jgi:hypothetical protein
LLFDLEYDDDGETIDFSPTASEMGSARMFYAKNSPEKSTAPLVDSAVDVAEEELLPDIEYNDDGETIDLSPTASETGSACASPDSNDIDTSGTSPNASMTNVSIALTNPSKRILPPYPPPTHRAQHPLWSRSWVFLHTPPIHPSRFVH